MLDEVLFEGHQVIHVIEGDLWLDHPELSQVTWRIGVLCTEGRTKGVDLTQCRSSQFAFELTGNGERRHLSEEVVIVDDGTILVLLEVVEILGGHLEHLACAFAVAGSDERRVEIIEAVLVEVLVNSNRHVVADAKDATKEVGAWTQMCLLAEEFHRVALLLQRILIGIAVAKHLNSAGLDLALLVAALAGHKFANDLETGTCGDTLQEFFVELGNVGYDLHA